MKKVRIGTTGLGRLGMQHALNLATKVSGVELVAVCDVDAVKLNEFCDSYGVKHRCATFEEMIAIDELDALMVVSPSSFHSDQIVKALNAGKHVFTDKPMGVTLQECEAVKTAVEAHPELLFMVGFMRRFDESYMYAKQKIDSGEVGRPVLFRSYSQDPEKYIAGAIAYAEHSGGQFLDMSTHDIDLARWMVGSEPKEVYAIGGCYAHPEYAQWNDGDNVSCLMKCQDDTMVFLLAGRTAPHGYNIETEIICTKGTLRISAVPSKNMVEVLDSHGVRHECMDNFLERFKDAYVNEVSYFVECVRENKKPSVGVIDGLRATEIAYKCKEAFESGKLVQI